MSSSDCVEMDSSDRNWLMQRPVARLQYDGSGEVTHIDDSTHSRADKMNVVNAIASRESVETFREGATEATRPISYRRFAALDDEINRISQGLTQNSHLGSSVESRANVVVNGDTSCDQYGKISVGSVIRGSGQNILRSASDGKMQLRNSYVEVGSCNHTPSDIGRNRSSRPGISGGVFHESGPSSSIPIQKSSDDTRHEPMVRGLASSRSCQEDMACLPSREYMPLRGMNPIDAFPPHYGMIGDRQFSSLWNRQGEPRVSIPLFTGNVEWRSFWLQFDLIASRFGWSEFNTLDRLVASLRDSALEYYAELPSEIRSDLSRVVDAFSRRFDDRSLPETHRRNLKMIQREKNEKLAEYVARVRKMTCKAYPGIYGTEVLEKMMIENILNGLEDQMVSYEVKVNSPRTVEEAVDMVRLRLACKRVYPRVALDRVAMDGFE